MVDAPTLAQHFPVHAIIGPALAVQTLGRTLSRLAGLDLPAPFDSLFELERPHVEPLDLAALGSLGPRLCLLRFKPNGMRIRGEFVPTADGKVLMLGSAGLSRSEDLQRFGLKIHDFTAHDPTADFLMALSTHRATLQDLKQLAGQLKRQKAELERSNVLLAEAEAEASRASGMKSRFLSHMSHELRTPLHAIAGLSRLLLDQTEPENRDQFLRSIHVSAELLVSLVGQVMDLGKIEAGCQEIELGPFEPHRIIEEIMVPLVEQARERRLVCRWRLDAPQDLWLNGDSLRIKRVLMSLVGNAVMLTEAGQVDLVANWRDGILRFEVKDSGLGFSGPELEKLLRPFGPAGAPSPGPGGFALGIEIARGLAEMMGGSITAAGSEGTGSVFCFEVPAPLATSPARERGELTRLPVARVVLIVDDNEINLLIGQKMLERDGHRVLVASDSDQAIDLIERRAPDVVLMDVLMPGRDGLETTRELRRRGLHVPVIALTANAVEGDRETCLAAGMVDYLPKPLDLRRLREAFSLLEHRSDRSR